MTSTPGRLRRFVAERAADRCEYCRLAQEGQEAAFHVDHIVPRVVHGPTTVDNLALACVSCSLRKEARRTALDKATGRSVPLFHPRCQDWNRHFRWDGVRIVGLTRTGRATIAALQMNRPVIVAIRAEERLRGRHPPGA